MNTQLFQDELLFDILDELNYYRNNKEKLLEKYVQERLSRSIDSYYKDLLSGFDALMSYSDKTVMKRILKLEK